MDMEAQKQYADKPYKINNFKIILGQYDITSVRSYEIITTNIKDGNKINETDNIDMRIYKYKNQIHYIDKLVNICSESPVYKIILLNYRQELLEKIKSVQLLSDIIISNTEGEKE